MSALVTVVTASKPVNKQVLRLDDLDDGTPSFHKESANARNIVDEWAVTIEVPDLAAMKELLEQVGEDEYQVIILGHVEGIPVGQQFKLLSTRRMAEVMKCSVEQTPGEPVEIPWCGDLIDAATRTKTMFRRSSWLLFEYDPHPDMPLEFCYQDAETWLNALRDPGFIPGMDQAGMVVTNSTSTRALFEGDMALVAGGFHAYVQAKDVQDLERFVPELRVHFCASDFAWDRPNRSRATGEVLGSTPCTIFDHAVLTSPERLIYEGKPRVSGEGLTVAPASVQVIPGGLLDTSLLQVDRATQRRVEKRTGCKVVKQGSGVRVVLRDDSLLTLDTELTTKHGAMTMREFWLDEGKRHVRCQAPFRMSDSWAAFLGKHRDGTPFLIDSGDGMKYTLSKDEIEEVKKDLGKEVEFVQACGGGYSFTVVGDELDEEPEPLDFVIEGVVPKGEVVLLGGDGGQGKSYLAMAMACCMAGGSSWGELGFNGQQVAFLSMEDSEQVMRLRRDQIIEEYGLDRATVHRRLKLVDAGEAEVLAFEGFAGSRRSLSTTKSAMRLLEQALGFDLVILDSASQAFAGNENDRVMVTQFIKGLRSFVRGFDGSMILVAHIDKVAARGKSNGSSYSGSTAWNNSAKARLALTDGVLRMEKNNYGALIQEIHIKRSTNGVPHPVDPAQQQLFEELQRESDKELVLEAIERAIQAGETVPTNTSSTGNVWLFLSRDWGGLSDEIKRDGQRGRKRTLGAIKALEQDGLIERAKYTTKGRNTREKWIVQRAASLEQEGTK